WRAISRRRRRTRLRTTALPTLRLTVKPTRMAGCSTPSGARSAGTGAAWSTNPGMAQRRPAWARRKTRPFRRRPGRAAAKRGRLGRQALAARAAAIGDDLAATHRRHAGPEAVPPLADQLARLISAFHDATPVNTRPPRGQRRGEFRGRRFYGARSS